MKKSSALDLQYLQTMAGGDKEVVKKLMKTLLKDLKDNTAKARKLCQQERWSELDRFCHYFKSTLSFSGNTPLINANLQLWGIAQKEGANATAPLINKLLKQLEQQSQLTIRELQNALKTI